MTYLELGNKTSSIVLVQPVDPRGLKAVENELGLIRSDSRFDPCILAVAADDWNRDLSPWSAPAVFGDEPFGEGGAATLEYVLSLCDSTDRTYYLGGYSLAGLFSLWAAYRTDRFAGIMAASPSVWFPGFSDMIHSRKILTGMVYLSLGDKEAKVKNPLLRTVADNIRDIHETLISAGVDCTLEWNPGNHFTDPGIRCAKGFVSLLNKAENNPR